MKPTGFEEHGLKLEHPNYRTFGNVLKLKKTRQIHPPTLARLPYIGRIDI
jgi:hypothetical protein